MPMGNLKKKIVMAIDGSKSSMVGAYLLKQQGHEIIGVAILFNQRNKGDLTFPSELIRYNVKEVKRVKELCETFDIPFYAVNAEDLYKDKIANFFLSSILSCRVFADEIFATSLITDILLEKCKILQGDAIATAHFAKVLYNEKNNGYIIGHSDDENNDQSHLLAHLKQEHLSKLILPLSSIRRDDVDKIADSMGNAFVKRTSFQKISLDNPVLHDYIKKYVPKSLIKEGSILNYITGDVIGDHSGLRFYPGQEIHSKFVVVQYELLSDKVFVCPKETLYYTHIFVKFLKTIPNYDISRPLYLFMKSKSLKKSIPCCLIFKNNRVAVVEFEKKISGRLYSGEYLIFYNKRGADGRIVATGLCAYSYFKAFGRRFTLPLRGEEREIYENHMHKKDREGF